MWPVRLSKKEKAQALLAARKKEKNFRKTKISGCFLLIFAIILLFFSLLIISAAFFQKQKSAFFYKFDSRGEPATGIAPIPASEIDHGQLPDGILEISEAELTAIIVGAVEKSQADFTDVQVAITAQNIEISGKITSPVRAFVTVGIFPKITDNQIDYDLINVSMGNISLPVPLVRGMVENIINDGIKEVNEFLKDNYFLKSIILGEGKIIIYGEKI